MIPKVVAAAVAVAVAVAVAAALPWDSSLLDHRSR